jgi:ferredoxin-NADP reductase
MVVDSKLTIASDIALFCLADADGGDLPTWSAGAHIDLTLPSGIVRQYSLCGDPADRRHYWVAVARSQDSRGGSRELHENIGTGTSLRVRGPRNNFPLVEANSYLLLAGGIGVTPLIAMARELACQARDWRLVYGGRSMSAMAFRTELMELGGDRVDFVAQDERGLPDLGGALRHAAAGTAVYCCGPERMIQRVERLCAGLGDKFSLHIERFGEGPPVSVGRPDDVAFAVVLRRRNQVVQVAADRTVLEAVRAAIPTQPFSCLKGECGTCEVRVLAGEVDHRDTFLTSDEKAANQSMMICVSRA